MRIQALRKSRSWSCSYLPSWALYCVSFLWCFYVHQSSMYHSKIYYIQLLGEDWNLVARDWPTTLNGFAEMIERMLMESMGTSQVPDSLPRNFPFELVGSLQNSSRLELRCLLNKVSRSEVLRDDPFVSEQLFGNDNRFPSKPFMDQQKPLESCAVVSSSTNILRSNSDSHDAVIRYNHAPTEGFEKDVGTKESFRFINGRVLRFFTTVTSPLWDFFANPFAKFWTKFSKDHPTVPVLHVPEFDKGEKPTSKAVPLAKIMRLFHGNPDRPFHYFTQEFSVQAWDILQGFSHKFILPNKGATAGFFGVVIFLPYCQTLRAFEFIPSFRWDPSGWNCHYYETASFTNTCFMKSGHANSAQLNFLLRINEASKENVYRNGYMSFSLLSREDLKKCESILQKWPFKEFVERWKQKKHL
ncbi:unnamed protein product [Cyprideis torosa]|uniref:beta-galactoside alpha-(2,6)-sialyltransferase n=1 Tax=Cyprideis torosa TaxID=163714 RepID=A0A7R8WA41_9CRUS|nr:unnamed protein product [Cyprideis torosa]CAG0885068.1 unnamed protein product [Cyprideis torosa]